MHQIKQIKAGSNCYLITQGESSILVDTGLKGNEKKILRECQGKNVKLIVLTHGHIDHAQNASYLARELHAPIAMHRRDEDLIEDNLNQDMHASGFPGNVLRFFTVMSAKSTKLAAFHPEVWLKEGDSLEEYGIEAKVVELPGHTKGSIGILLEKEAFLVGDALMNMFGAGVSLLFENYEEMIKSAKKISTAGDVEIYFGHGKAVLNREWV